MRVIDIEDVVYAMRNQTQFVLRCEEVFHDKISSAAAAILSAQPRKPFVCLPGPSGSGSSGSGVQDGPSDGEGTEQALVAWGR